MPWYKNAQGQPEWRDAAPAAAPTNTRYPQMPVDPAYPYKGQQAAADVAGKNASTEKTRTDTEITVKTAPAVVAKAGADAVKSGADANITGKQDATNAGVIGTAERSKAISQYQAALALDKSIAEMEKLFQAGPGSTPGVLGALDFLPLEANKRFDKAATAQRGTIRNALGLTGGEANTAGEATANLGAYLPDSWSYDEANRDTFNRLRDLRDKALRQSIQTLGGVPDVNGNVTPVDVGKMKDAVEVAPWYQRERERYGAPIVDPGSAPQPPAGGAGGTGPQMGLAQGEAFSTPDDIARAELMNKALSRPGVTLDDLVNTARSYGGRVTMQEIGEFNRLLEAKKQGHNVSFIPYASGRRNPISVAAGNILTSPLGTATATAVSGLGFNLLDAALPEQMQALRQLNPNAAAIGDVGGAIGGTMALSKLVRTATEKGLSRFAPNAANRLLSNSGRANLARNVATDTAYGTAYGANVEDNAALGGASAAVGSLGGNVAGRIIGAGIGGVTRTPFAQYLKDQGIDLTIGQQMGGTAKRLEDAAMSIPGPGDMIIARQQDSIRGLNEAAFREVGVTGYGDDAMEALGRNRQQAYTDSVAGRQYDLNDPQTVQDMQAALAARDGLAPDYASKFDIAVQNRIAGTPIGQTGQMTGEQYQQAMRGLNDYKNVQGASGFENDYRNAIGGVQSALRGVVERQTPEVIPALQQADQLYRSEKILQDALNRNRKDASGIGTDLFRPSDLTEAVFQNSKKYGGKAPFFELGRAAQNVIPSKLPDSGTARRALTAGIGTGGLAGLGAANSAGNQDASLTDILSGAGTGGMSALGIAALLSLGGTKAAQQALTKTLMERPQTLQNVGAALRKHQGLFGTAAVPLVIEASQ